MFWRKRFSTAFFPTRDRDGAVRFKLGRPEYKLSNDKEQRWLAAGKSKISYFYPARKATLPNSPGFGRALRLEILVLDDLFPSTRKAIECSKISLEKDLEKK